MRYNTIVECDVVNAMGVSSSLFFQGCSHRCNGCFNPETWDFEGGEELTEEVKERYKELCSKSYITSIALLGGDPLQQPKEELICFLEELRELNKPIIVWTGYRFYDIMNNRDLLDIVSRVDYIIDGEYIDSQRDTTLKLRGSRNQNIWKREKGVWVNTTSSKREGECYRIAN